MYDSFACGSRTGKINLQEKKQDSGCPWMVLREGLIRKDHERNLWENGSVLE